MTQTLTEQQIAQSLALRTLEVMYLTRFMDDKCFKLSRQNKGGTFQLSVAGHELIGAVSALSLIPVDHVVNMFYEISQNGSINRIYNITRLLTLLYLALQRWLKLFLT